MLHESIGIYDCWLLVLYLWNLLFKTQQKSRNTVQKSNKEQVHRRLRDFPNLPPATQVNVTLVARPLLTPVAQKLCRCEHGVFMSRTYVYSVHPIQMICGAWRRSKTTLIFCCQHWRRNTSGSRIKYITKGGFLSSRRWWTLSETTVKLLYKFLLINEN
jgi:hypothetical protein